MEYVILKNSDLRVSRLCMGGCPLGGYGWGEIQENELIDAVHRALELGVNFFDTADTYGLGKSEETLAKALGNRRKDVIIATKFGVRVENGKTFYDNSPEYIKKACLASLKRLNTDYIDLYQIHYRDNKTPLSDVVKTLDGLKAEGKIRYYGLSNIHKKDLDELEKYKNKFVSFQDEYSLACRKNEKDIKLLKDKLGLSFLTWGSLGQGILTGKYDKDVKFTSNDRRSRDIYVNFHGDKLLKNLEIVEEMKKIAVKVDKPLSAIAIRWILDYMPESVVLVGVKRPSQIENNNEAFGWKLNQEYIEILNKISQDSLDSVSI